MRSRLLERRSGARDPRWTSRRAAPDAAPRSRRRTGGAIPPDREPIPSADADATPIAGDDVPSTRGTRTSVGRPDDGSRRARPTVGRDLAGDRRSTSRRIERRHRRGRPSRPGTAVGTHRSHGIEAIDERSRRSRRATSGAAEMASPEVAADPDRLRDLGQRFAELEDVVAPVPRVPRQPSRRLGGSARRSRRPRPTPRWRRTSRQEAERVEACPVDASAPARAAARAEGPQRGQATSSSRSARAPADRRRPCGRATSSRCTGGSPSGIGGRPRSSRPRRAISAGSRRCPLEVRGRDAYGRLQARGRRAPGPAGPRHRVARAGSTPRRRRWR